MNICREKEWERESTPFEPPCAYPIVLLYVGLLLKYICSFGKQTLEISVGYNRIVVKSMRSTKSLSKYGKSKFHLPPRMWKTRLLQGFCAMPTELGSSLYCIVLQNYMSSVHGDQHKSHAWRALRFCGGWRPLPIGRKCSRYLS